jgi:hypothetical protein
MISLLLTAFPKFPDQFYVMSTDLSSFVVDEATKSNCSYCVGLEGHDISTMAFLFPDIMNIVMIGRHQQFWGDPEKRFYHGPDRSTAIPRKTADNSITARKGPLVLVGIFSTETSNSNTLRERILALFELRNDSRVCCLSDFRQLSAEERRGSRCELVYTFVLGAVGPNYNGTSFPTEITGYDERPLVVDRSSSNSTRNQLFLNIRDNMNEGKSQTWLNHASRLAKEFDFEYVAKCDEDSIFDLSKYFNFTDHYLPRAPYNKGFYAGRVLGTAFHKVKNCKDYRDTDPFSLGLWNRARNISCQWPTESFFDEYFDGVHFYAAGMCAYMILPCAARVLTLSLSTFDAALDCSRFGGP